MALAKLTTNSRHSKRSIVISSVVEKFSRQSKQLVLSNN